MTESIDTSPGDLLLAREVKDLREQIEDQFNAHQTLQRRFMELLKEQGANIKPVFIKEKILRLFDKPTTGCLETEPLEPAPQPLGEKWWPTGRPEPRPLAPQTGWGSYSMRPVRAKALGISVCGMSKKKKRHIVEMIARRQSADRDFRPVFLTDSPDFTPFIPFGFIAEYIPPATKRDHTRTEAAWARSVAERREFIVQKWGLSEIIQFGPVPFGQ